ncbi:hypothetical protein [Litorihabitans aurantiacus]|uniref:Uncharacterized protein n=1 Tax=Litorihabitans aurantiacus TaxID=1930061 RepID=A0AA38CSQ2_9MICO|nr:hypothetical protein [Litorihabitans aurantiacus]GMA31644.1 hypothetical protein GCM10025875_16360 [Litorihabitans aurantiacus]
MTPADGERTAARGRLARLTAGVAGAAAVLTVLTLLARLVGFARWFALNAWVGPNEVGTAYSTANTVPNVLFEVAAGERWPAPSSRCWPDRSRSTCAATSTARPRRC